MRILLADDHPMIRTALEVLLRDTEFEIAGTAGTGDSTLRAIEELEPDILLLDLQMPGGSGMEVLRAVRAEGKPPATARGSKKKSLKIVLLTAAIDDPSLMEAKSLNVQGIVLKNSDPAFLFECLDRVRRGLNWMDPELAERAKLLARSQSGGKRAPLTPRERDLINSVRQGLRNREIAEQLGVTEGTVKAYLHSIFEKLEVTSRTELAIRADEFLAGASGKT